MKKVTKIITGFLGISMFVFGILKFVNPFKGWYTTQVIDSELPFQTISYWSGQIGEIIIGLLLLIILFSKKINLEKRLQIFYFGNIIIIIMMIMAIYVHAHPNVSADVLPLKIKAPYIPGFFMVLAVLNIYLNPKNKFIIE